MRTTRCAARSGLSLVEVVVCTVLMGVVLVGAMKCLGAVIHGRLATGDSVVAKQLASQLMAEILENEYREPIDPPVFGPESNESAGMRADWDDVDDYHLWSSSPPEDRAGAGPPNLSGWQRDVTVQWVAPNDPAQVVGSDLGLKRVTVTVKRDGKVLAREVALRSDTYTGSGS